MPTSASRRAFSMKRIMERVNGDQVIKILPLKINPGLLFFVLYTSNKGLMKRILTISAILLGALICYSIGFTQGVEVLIFGGIILEITFWVMAFNQSKPIRNTSR